MVRRISEITVTLDFIFRLVLCRLDLYVLGDDALIS